jgi:hypothetical protein
MDGMGKGTYRGSKRVEGVNGCVNMKIIISKPTDTKGSKPEMAFMIHATKVNARLPDDRQALSPKT